MDAEYEKIKIQKRVEELLTQKFDDNNFNPYRVLYVIDKDENYYKTIEMIKYLFSLGEDGKTYLWNMLWSPIINNELNEFELSDLSVEEVSFLKDMYKTKDKFISLYGKYYSIWQNINHGIVTDRLILSPFNDELDNKFYDFLISNPTEGYNYYGTYAFEVDRAPIVQKTRQLSFAIIDKESNELIGYVALTSIRNDVVYNLEYFIMPSYRMQGYAKEAVTELIKAVKNKEVFILEKTIREGVLKVITADIRCIETQIRVNNIPSLRLVNSLGFTQNGKIVYLSKRDDQYIDGIVYDLLIDS